MANEQVDPIEFKDAMAAIDKRLQALEASVFLQTPTSELAPPTQKPPRVAPVRPSRPLKVTTEHHAPSGNLLGVVGVCCLILAMILLIKFSIDSGWLTPFRQLLISAIFGAALIFSPRFLSTKDRDYLSLLPAGGVVIWHLTIYGAVLYHQLMDPLIGIGLISVISLISLLLLRKYHEDLYALLAIGGTYVGALLLKGAFVDLLVFSAYLLLWDVVYSTFAVSLKNRRLISITAYFALALVSLISFQSHSFPEQIDSYMQLSILQFLQIMVFTIASGIFSVRNKLPLTEEESLQLFPVYLFFYGQVYYFLQNVSEFSANSFSFLWASIIAATFFLTKIRLKNKEFESQGAIWAYITMIVVHAGYFVILDDVQKLIAGLFVFILLAIFSKQFQFSSFKYAKIILLVPLSYSTLMILLKFGQLNSYHLILFGFLYGAFFLTARFTSKIDILLLIANVLIVTSIMRLDIILPEGAIGPLCVLYAFTCLVIAMRLSDKILAQASLPVIFIAVARFMFLQFGQLSQGERIVALVVMGVLIYAGGYVFRQVKAK